MEKWTILESKYLHRKEWLTIREDKCRMDNGTVIPAFYVNEYSDWVNAFALTKEGKVLLVRQYRHGIDSIETELPGGVSEHGESMEAACRREVEEETGYTFESWKCLGKVSANASTTNNFTHFFLATGGSRTSAQKLDESEEIEVLELSIDEVKAIVRENRMMQSLHVNCIFYALMELGELNL
ncbi:NUDIX hydrolase [Flaviaesturariibacter aridisoli]|uniref:GDP-mannose pyrophosphatase n=1 Tax=Flaviaesturariibacter aridisoli TaxID=2545761 RepID=A0A4R4E4T4_9BACT|nr:NUDIX hydrolase [Flaviaesturariibacter aridisoli]TCZ73977.1 NUDIX hydrolase [Flaviaesturariibacter aridisoli]